MRKYTVLFSTFTMLFIAALFFSFSSNSKSNDSKLVGIWKGFEKDKQIEGIEKHWIQQRFKNGTYVIMFTTKEDCEVETFTEKGKWWTENGKFYENSGENSETDIYYYNVKNDEEVEFKSIKLTGKDNDTYVFSDYKLNLY